MQAYRMTLRRNRICAPYQTLIRQALNENDTIVGHIGELRRNFAKHTHVLDSLSYEERNRFESSVESLVRKQVERKRNILRKRLGPAKPIDKCLLEVLSLGPQSCGPTGRTKQLDLEVQFKNLFSQLSDLSPSSSQNVAQLKSTLVNTCYYRLDNKPMKKDLVTPQHRERLKGSGNNHDVILCGPDKGTVVVILNRSDYVTKMNNIIRDSTKFKKMSGEKDKTEQIE
ncbi:unnamed protein product [Echinostoma caproni]|uniref:Uncharacterized protein n=1 Tax=Echinostoma caproni TaxID=27848 RepID=A0A183AB41_9TREM|nr:unnamed protein product [Echinostoma caproni]